MPEIGPTLREARMRARIDISEIEAQTKIRAKYLRALENEEWSLLPGPTFIKSFLRTYAEAVGIDSRPLVDEYRLQHEHPDAAHEPIMPSSRRGGDSGERASTAYRFAVAAIVLLIVVLVALLVLGKGSSKSNPPASSSGVTLSLRATAPVRVCLSEGSGGRLLHYTPLAAGQRTRSYHASEFILWAENRSLRLTIDGTEHQISAGGAFTVTAAGAQDAGSEGRLRACG
jgi:hypothetical protein